MSANRPSPDNAQLLDRLLAVGKALFIGAHPDDIEFYCAGLVRLMRSRGVEVVFAVGTRGGKGRAGAAGKRLEALRSRHQVDAAAILGVERVLLFDYPDKALAEHVEPFAEDLRGLIGREKPGVIFAWDPDHIYNPHPDHRAAARAAAIATAGENVCYYGTREPNVWLGYGEDLFAVKLRALRAHRTEMPWYFVPLAKRILVKRTAGEGARIGARYAEVYRLVGLRRL